MELKMIEESKLQEKYVCGKCVATGKYKTELLYNQKELPYASCVVCGTEELMMDYLIKDLPKYSICEDFRKEILTALALHQRNKASEMLCDKIKEIAHIYTTRDDEKSEMWIYDSGVYEPQGKTFVREITREILGLAFTAQICNEVIAKVEVDTYIDKEKFFSNNIIDEIVIENGILNIFTKELSPFNPSKIFFNKLPLSYDNKATCPKIDEFLSTVMANEEDKKVFYEIGGFCLLKEYRYEKAFMFVGSGRNGKSKTLELLKRAIGIKNCASIELSNLSSEGFQISELFGKLANVSGDISNTDLKNTGIFKSLTGRDLVGGQRKFLRNIYFENYAKLIFACNELPMVFDLTRAFWDRWVLLKFPYTFVSKEEFDKLGTKECVKIRDENIIDKISSKEELSGLLNAFLVGLERLMKMKDFSSTKGCEEVKSFWIRSSNSFIAFCWDNIEQDYNSKITKKELRRKYSEYCKKHGVGTKSDMIIKRVLQESYGANETQTRVEDNWDRFWEGIKWKDNM